MAAWSGAASSESISTTTSLYSPEGHAKLSFESDGSLVLCESYTCMMFLYDSLIDAYLDSPPNSFSHAPALHADGCGCNETTPDKWQKMWESKSSFNEIRDWEHYYSQYYGKEGEYGQYIGETVVQTFSDPKPVKATLGFTLEGQLALIYSWMGDTAATQPHTSGSSYSNLPLFGMPGTGNTETTGTAKDQNLLSCSSFLPPYRVTVTGKSQQCLIGWKLYVFNGSNLT